MARQLPVLLCSTLLLGTSASSAIHAESLDEKIARLEGLLNQQQAKIAAQEAKLDAQAVTIANQKSVLDIYHQDLEVLRLEVLGESRGADPNGSAQPANSLMIAQNDRNQPTQTVGEAPKETRRAKPEIEAIADIGGVLTPKGKLVIEPSLEYSHSDVNRLTFRGIEILSSLAIGIIDAVEADRDSVTAALTGRLGLTNRLELEMKVPYVYRDDEETATIPDVMNSRTTRNLDGDGIGDIEAALHYQLNSGQGGWPFFIANARFKSTTGDGPFDISRDDDGIERELATGSGFYSFEPSITALFPSAPAVFFANLGYLINFEDDVDKNLGSSDTPQRVGNVDPGDAVRFSFGMAYSINERAAFTLGFKNDWIQETETEINGVTFDSTSLTVASMLLGYSYQLTPKVGINTNLELGVTDDAPDLLLTFRVPFRTSALW